MPELNWNIFNALSGSKTTNWELLCHELVRRNYERYGRYCYQSQQPGIEFHLELTKDCSLGVKGQHWGWQCRWYDLAPGKQIGNVRRKKIEEAIRTTERHLPKLTDWVLWTRHPLTPTDQKWYNSISTSFTKRLWAEAEIVNLLTDEAKVLRGTYFGELVLSQKAISRIHDDAMASIRKRWEPQLHVEVDAERILKSALGVSGTWSEVRETSDRLARRVVTIKSECDGLSKEILGVVQDTSDTIKSQSDHLRSLADVLDRGDLNRAHAIITTLVEPRVTKRTLARIAARLRSARHPISLSISAAMWEISHYFSLLERLKQRTKERFFAVVGDAGFGKTFLAVELTKPTDQFSGGILLHGKHLEKKGTLDSLVRSVDFGGTKIDELLEAIEAEAARCGCRIPIVIDGLNESEDPYDWRDLLETLQSKLSRTNNVVVVVTLRTSLAENILPSHASTIHLNGFAHDPESAISKYFEYYKIEQSDSHSHWPHFGSPLFLSLFCQATNPDRQVTVSAASIPRSLIAVFEKYRQVIIARTGDTLNLAYEDIQLKLERVGLELWNENTRALDFAVLRQIVDGGQSAWRGSLTQKLEEEGVLSRATKVDLNDFGQNQGAVPNQVSAILYDAFAGFIIADAVLKLQKETGLSQWLADNYQRLDLTGASRHPFAEDILNSLVGLSPRRLQCQLWPHMPPAMRDQALFKTMDLEPELIDFDGRTRSELVFLCRDMPVTIRSERVLNRLWWTRAEAMHPLNADFLHEVLKSIEVGKRDLIWSEWTRQFRKECQDDLIALEGDWRASNERVDRDRLLARWVSWLLTSTDGNLRDRATQALYWYAVNATQCLFNMAIESLEFNDPYVTERIIAVAYGVVMGGQLNMGTLAPALIPFLNRLAEAVLGRNAESPTNHWLIQEYVRGLFDCARALLPRESGRLVQRVDGALAFGLAPYVSANEAPHYYTGHLDSDFENDEVGRLFSDRSKYDDKHPEFSRVIKDIRARVYNLGWRPERFDQIDRIVVRERFYNREDTACLDSYATKYARIGLHEAIGILAKKKPQFLCREGRLSAALNIDPSFPEIPAPADVSIRCWVSQMPTDDREWLQSGDIDVPDHLLRPLVIDNQPGPWIAIDGYIRMENEHSGRQVFGFVRGLLVAVEDVERVVSSLETQEYLGNSFIPDEPSDYYTFAGEIPWSTHFTSCRTSKCYDELYRRRLDCGQGEGAVVEVLSHRYAWESYHSSMNRAGRFSVPSKLFSLRFSLRSARSSLKQYDRMDNVAAIPLSPPTNCDPNGNLLYLREDLVLHYAARRNAELVWVVWGERNLTQLSYPRPSWCDDIYRRNGHLWRRVQRFSGI